MASLPPRLRSLRKLLRRAKLMGAELQDWSHERQMLWRAKLKEQFQVAKDLKKLPPGVALHALLLGGNRLYELLLPRYVQY